VLGPSPCFFAPISFWIFSPVSRPQNLIVFRHLFGSRAKEPPNQFIRRLSSSPNFLVLVLAISYRKCEAKAKWTYSRVTGNVPLVDSTFPISAFTRHVRFPCLYTAHMKVPRWLRRDKYACPDCDPTGSGKCAQCGGTGRDFTGSACAICHATGHCHSCGGTGSVDSDTSSMIPDWIARFFGLR
jgi:hypothetical protein